MAMRWQFWSPDFARAARRDNHIRGHGGDSTGANPRKLAQSNPGHMHRGHDLWNISLKFLCESTQTRGTQLAHPKWLAPSR